MKSLTQVFAEKPPKQISQGTYYQTTAEKLRNALSHNEMRNMIESIELNADSYQKKDLPKFT